MLLVALKIHSFYLSHNFPSTGILGIYFTIDYYQLSFLFHYRIFTRSPSVTDTHSMNKAPFFLSSLCFAVLSSDENECVITDRSKNADSLMTIANGKYFSLCE